MVLQVVYCADARTNLTGDVKRVSEDGILTLAKALQVGWNSALKTQASARDEVHQRDGLMCVKITLEGSL